MKYFKVPLSGINGKGKYMLLDEEDIHIALGRRISMSPLGYARTTDKGATVFVHHLILPCKDGLMIDHINRNRLDNRRKNLRLVTANESQQNRKTWGKSQYYGVSFVDGRRWRAKLTVNGKTMVKNRTTEIEAAEARDEMVKAAGLTHTPLNFPDE